MSDRSSAPSSRSRTRRRRESQKRSFLLSQRTGNVDPSETLQSPFEILLKATGRSRDELVLVLDTQFNLLRIPEMLQKYVKICGCVGFHKCKFDENYKKEKQLQKTNETRRKYTNFTDYMKLDLKTEGLDQIVHQIR